MEETEYLHAIWLERKQAWMHVEDIIRASISGERAKGRGSVMRKNFVNHIHMMTIKPSKNYDDEIEKRTHPHVLRYHWAPVIMNSFTLEERKIIREFITPYFGPVAKMAE